MGFQINSSGAGAVPTGAMLDYAGAAAPTGYVLCDGSAISRTTFVDLFTAIGTAYGVGDGSTTFNVPDTRGRMVVGKGTHVDVDTLNDNDGLAVASRTPKHTHGPGNLGGTTGTPSANQAAATPLLGSVPSNSHTHNFTVTTGVTGASNAGYVVANMIIKT